MRSSFMKYHPLCKQQPLSEPLTLLCPEADYIMRDHPMVTNIRPACTAGSQDGPLHQLAVHCRGCDAQSVSIYISHV
jgi:hypothetical protein